MSATAQINHPIQKHKQDAMNRKRKSKKALSVTSKGCFVWISSGERCSLPKVCEGGKSRGWTDEDWIPYLPSVSFSIHPCELILICCWMGPFLLGLEWLDGFGLLEALSDVWAFLHMFIHDAKAIALLCENGIE